MYTSQHKSTIHSYIPLSRWLAMWPVSLGQQRSSQATSQPTQAEKTILCSWHTQWSHKGVPTSRLPAPGRQNTDRNPLHWQWISSCRLSPSWCKVRARAQLCSNLQVLHEGMWKEVPIRQSQCCVQAGGSSYELPTTQHSSTDSQKHETVTESPIPTS